ncbi:GspH/FimT family pseudopilin [Marinomonas fungiae]|uniref:Type II secretion system protein H n=1 Tax=Marinomonas fungiae TaxID=1137284 RepID=A0A0K6IH59_9GAMM|nr:GspH/FimT family pseudopilin [Marinomonas fungiae]CUB02459.1 prepilin-type N-terminal cleavage/methylation domain [Marinomonas fungiae]
MNSCKGFSLLELLIVVAMISIVSSAFLSSNIVGYYQRWQARRILSQDVSDLLLLISRARSLAMSSGQSVLLCGGANCNGAWQQQAFIRITNQAGALQTQKFSPETTIVWRGFPAQRAYLQFLPTGLSSYQNGSFYLCRAQAEALRILVNQSGRAYLDDQRYDAKECL